MQAFSWPGNIRQLQNVIEHSAILSDQPVLRIPPSLLVEKQLSVARASKLDAALHDSERQMIEQALAGARGRVSGSAGAASNLGIPASTLESKIKALADRQVAISIEPGRVMLARAADAGVFY